ncbi:hypothetical protein Q8A64_14395 [Oxalobacteraceae bacterium R-40]|uniref:Uncharacterized protein n=1 Tax=Keguizhuia sedimenti TaxID=3064264 RepID=A0ABU1BT74_9BURK|nr:hypothetical protein [Oxalobacteraceae bacterium R-40]
MSGLIRLLVLLTAFTCSFAANSAAPLPAQSSSESGVTIKATPKNLQGSIWEFELVLDTHSQDLSDDLVKNVTLLKSDGSQVRPVGWQGDPPGGHHRKGVLRFDAITPVPAILEMRITRPGEAKPRTYRWTLS